MPDFTPCCPGLESSLHLESSDRRALFRKRSVPSRRASLHFGPVYRAIFLFRQINGDQMRRRFGGNLRRERRRLARAFEAGAARRRPGQRVALAIGDGDDRVVERRVDMRNAFGDVLLDLLARPRDSFSRCLCHSLVPYIPQCFDRWLHLPLHLPCATWQPAWRRDCSPAWCHATLTPAAPSWAPCVSARWCVCADRGPAILCDAARPDSSRGP